MNSVNISINICNEAFDKLAREDPTIGGNERDDRLHGD